MKAKQIEEAVRKLADRFLEEYKPLRATHYDVGGTAMYSGGDGYVTLENARFDITRFNGEDVEVTFKLRGSAVTVTWEDFLDSIKDMAADLNKALESREAERKAEAKKYIARLEAKIKASKEELLG